MSAIIGQVYKTPAAISIKMSVVLEFWPAGKWI
jgi:hypothetical protein